MAGCHTGGHMWHTCHDRWEWRTRGLGCRVQGLPKPSYSYRALPKPSYSYRVQGLAHTQLTDTVTGCRAEPTPSYSYRVQGARLCPNPVTPSATNSHTTRRQAVAGRQTGVLVGQGGIIADGLSGRRGAGRQAVAGRQAPVGVLQRMSQYNVFRF